ncbi:UPF0149 family protein [Thiomonas sp. FB-Cd]|uniref:UPF0149 family protein n=1 Tax=Thiomonas sp. FB-Cd TaxID=1158292 RepID=UPI0004DFBAAB|nr:UPF0149 family protein [Thiomonas sp. FB-Cd]
MDPAIFNAPLTDAEIDKLDHFLLYEADVDDSMTLDMLDGYLHALAISPTTVHPTRWMPRIWGEDFTELWTYTTSRDAPRARLASSRFHPRHLT